jgi:K+-sensing histidine kinase KdpD
MLRLGKIPEIRELLAALKEISVKPILGGVGICTVAALLLCFFLDEGRDLRLAAPAMCLLVVIVTSIYLGRLAGVFGAVAASCVLAVLLYSPFGTLYVEEHAARMMLNFLLIGAVGVALLVPRRPSRNGAARPPRRRDGSRQIPPLLSRHDGD